MDSILIVVLITLFGISFFIDFYLYNVCLAQQSMVFELSALITRTFREYYKGEDIEPVVVNNGIDLVWTGDVEGTFNEDNRRGFITVMTHDGNVNSPIKNHKEADILAGKIINVVYEFVKDREQ